MKKECLRNYTKRKDVGKKKRIKLRTGKKTCLAKEITIRELNKGGKEKNVKN